MAVEIAISPEEVESKIPPKASSDLDPTLLEKVIQFAMLRQPDTTAYPLLANLLDRMIPAFVMPDRSQYSGTIE